MLKNVKLFMLTGVMIFLLIFSFIAAKTGWNFIQLKDPSTAHQILEAQGKSGNEDFDYAPVEEELVNPTFFSLMRELSDPEYAYGEESYLEAYAGHDARSEFQKKNFGLHMIAGSACLITGFFQFWPAFRRKNRKIHRVMGVLYVISAFTLGISSWIYLGNAGFETTFDSLAGNWALYILSSTEMLAICIAGFFLLRRQYAAHMGWMAISLGAFLTAPWQRYDWLMLSWLDTGQTFAMINGVVNTVLFTQGYFTAYWVMVMNRQSSPLNKTYNFEGFSLFAKTSVFSVTAIAVIATFVFYIGSNGIYGSELVGQSINFDLWDREQQIILADFSFLYPLFITLTLVMTTLSAYMMLNYRLHDGLAYLLGGVAIVIGLIELNWGVKIGYPTQYLSSGGSHYIGWSFLHIVFGILLIAGRYLRWNLLQVEWTMILWVLSLSMASLPLIASVSSLFEVFPKIYVDGGQSAILIVGGIMQGLVIIAIAVATHGPATKARNVH
ncbi:hypothetical protein CS022_20760 [Veronia nyctiphanis]|uniref:Uncharacterized protein n=1 Tax=Veronia nyctiphanis TaxID=1278244 RepID=A0A4Q0YRC4_9GAMM|nr:DUF2306 domain-containing protein [Veronia nyctiphanis]RXJ71521.1 hypothetical protein CS022_20760 [Veronia nyctiphanis]